MGDIIKIDKPYGKPLPCPFCGSEEIVAERYNTVVGDRYRIFCCGCIAGIDPGWAQSVGAVLNMWNKRS